MKVPMSDLERRIRDLKSDLNELEMGGMTPEVRNAFFLLVAEGLNRSRVWHELPVKDMRDAYVRMYEDSMNLLRAERKLSQKTD